MKYSQLRLKFDDFLETRLGKGYEENSIYWFQCVWWVKLYSKEVLGVILWSFGGNAHSGWLNSAKTFDPDLWHTTEYIERKGQPPVWSLVFFKPTKSNPDGHVGVCKYRLKDGRILLLEQNGIAGGKNQPWDEFNLRVWNLSNCSGWRSLKFEWRPKDE